MEKKRDSLRVLHLEDNSRDAELIQSLLEPEWTACQIVRVKDRAAFEQAIQTETFDLVLSDYALPNYDGLSALKFVRQTRPHTPFILLSGTLGEEQAVDSLKSGATDYVLKQRPTRLVPAIRRAVDESAEHERCRLAEQQVRDQAAYLNKARDAIHVQDLHGQIRYWNQGAERMYGWTAAEVLGQAADQVLGTDARASSLPQAQLARTGEWSGDLKRMTRDQREVMVESRWTLLADSRGNPQSTLVIDTDITEKRNLEQQLLRSQRLESLGALAGGIAHDLNNVLAPIMMATEILRPELGTPSSQKMLEMVHLSAHRGASMVRQILSFARGVSGELTVLRVDQVAQEMLKLARETFPRTLSIQSRLAENLYPIKGDATQLHQVLMNLFVNARDAMPQGGRLTIEMENVLLDRCETRMQAELVSGPYVRITVADTGDGIPRHLLDKIYEPFFTTKPLGKGTGLGLSIVLSIVKNHQGFVEVASEVGQGTKFEVFLPAHGIDTARQTKKSRLFLGRGEQVLLLDDETAIREIARQILTSFNYQVLTASNGDEALSLFQEHRHHVQVVIVSLIMPGGDGPAIVSAIRRITPSVRIIGITAGEGTVADDLRLDGRLRKPYAPEELLRTLRAVLES